MCEIVTSIGLALGASQATAASVGAAAISTTMGVASAGAQMYGQRQQAKTQAKVQKNASAAERERYLREVSSMRVQQGQEEVAAAQRVNESARKAREARATARVSAGEAGVA